MTDDIPRSGALHTAFDAPAAKAGAGNDKLDRSCNKTYNSKIRKHSLTNIDSRFVEIARFLGRRAADADFTKINNNHSEDTC